MTVDSNRINILNKIFAVRKSYIAIGALSGLLVLTASPVEARHHQIPEEAVVQPASLEQSRAIAGSDSERMERPVSRDGSTKVVIMPNRHRQVRQAAGEERSLNERVKDILHPAEKQNTVADMSQLPVPPLAVPQTVSAADDSIIGTPLASQQQCVDYLLSVNPHPFISVTPEQLVSYYYMEGEREGIRPDVAFVQALKETGFFRYGGTVTADQNNYCGLGTTSAQVKGAYFPTAQLGVRAHIQHLLAYASTRQPQEPVVDPRYELVRSTYGTNTLGRWEDLNGRWAVPGYSYGQSILSMYRALLTK